MISAEAPVQIDHSSQGLNQEKLQDEKVNFSEKDTLQEKAKIEEAKSGLKAKIGGFVSKIKEVATSYKGKDSDDVDRATIKAINGLHNIELEMDQVQKGEVVTPRQRAIEALIRLRDREKSTEVKEAFETLGISGDSDKIEGHQIDFISEGESTVVTFKVTADWNQKIKEEVIPRLKENGEVSDSRFLFYSAQSRERSKSLASAWIIPVDENTSLIVSKGGFPSTGYSHNYEKPIKNKFGDVVDYEKEETETTNEMRSLIGAIKIEVKGIEDPEEIALRVEAAFHKLTLDGAMGRPDQKAIDAYKTARFRWFHRLEEEDAFTRHKKEFKKNTGMEINQHLKVEEVFPGYSTVVDEGATDILESENGPIVLFSTIYNYQNLPSVLKNGMLSSHERYKRGIQVNGSSTDDDFRTGGADSVFIRTMVGETANSGTLAIVYETSILDRTDWYAYRDDNYGTTDPVAFASRPSPRDFFGNRENLRLSNELMFRRGIPPEMIKGIYTEYEEEKVNLIRELERNGITQFRGKPLSEAIKVGHIRKPQ